MVRNIAALKNQGPSFNPRPRPDTSSSDRAEVLRAQAAQSRAQAAPQSNIQANRDRYLPEVQALQKRQFEMVNRPGGTNNPPVEEVPLPGGRPTGPLDFRDSSYNSQIAAIERALRDFETGSATRGQRYQEDFTTGLGRLGFRPAPQPMMAARSMEGADGAEGAVGFATGPMQGSFDIEGEMDRTSAAARGTRGMRDEFAGRGTLRSSDFANSFSDFQNRLQQQLTGMETGRTRFGEDLQTELAQFQTRAQEQRAAAQEAAQNRALMRQLSQMGF
jgi:hypothetical protein